MAHEKIYGICEDKCRVQIARGIAEEIVNSTNYDDASVGIIVPTDGVRKIYKGIIQSAFLMKGPDNFQPGYCSEIVIRLTKHVNKPSDFLRVNQVNAVFLNDNLYTGQYNCLHYHLSWDGFRLCIWCTGYAT